MQRGGLTPNPVNGLGEVVVRDYTSSGYPITPEVLEVSDAGLRAIGAFPA